jgi:hypothetical protein
MKWKKTRCLQIKVFEKLHKIRSWLEVSVFDPERFIPDPDHIPDIIFQDVLDPVRIQSLP